MEHAFLQARIARKTIEARDIVGLELVPAEGSSFPAFSAGSHIDVEVRPGLIRQYSLCNDPTEQHRYQLGVLRDPASRGGSIAVHDELAEGQVIRISVPRNHFALVPAKRSLLFAGGIGVTPILCMAERLAQIGADFEMHYCSRSPARTAFAGRIRRSAFAARVQFHFDDGEPAQRLDLLAVLGPPDTDTHLYVCGPAGFIDFVTSTAKARGWSAAQIHFEYFAGHAIDTSNDGSFAVKLASSGRILTVPADKTVVRVLAENGVEVPTACEQGVCGTCLTRVLEGEPEHRDSFLTEAEQARNDQFTPCCSRARSKMLVLDL
jgi:vanillate monooxygenase ferredoxin subunit